MHMRERIALLTAVINDCGYCVSAHAFRGTKAGLSASELAATQKSPSEPSKSTAALQFIDTLLQQHGLITDADFSRVRSHGWADEEIGEIIAHVALNVFSNYYNHVAIPVLNFPATAITR